LNSQTYDGRYQRDLRERIIGLRNEAQYIRVILDVPPDCALPPEPVLLERIAAQRDRSIEIAAMCWPQKSTLLGGIGPASFQAKRPPTSDLDFAGPSRFSSRPISRNPPGASTVPPSRHSPPPLCRSGRRSGSGLGSSGLGLQQQWNLDKRRGVSSLHNAARRPAARD
jgi:hypothetical protein